LLGDLYPFESHEKTQQNQWDIMMIVVKSMGLTIKFHENPIVDG
jgi:hypothetical protein